MNRMTLDKLATMTMNGFVELEKRLGDRLDKVENRLDKVESNICGIENEISGIKIQLVGINQRLDYHAETYAKAINHERLEKRVTKLERKHA